MLFSILKVRGIPIDRLTLTFDPVTLHSVVMNNVSLKFKDLTLVDLLVIKRKHFPSHSGLDLRISDFKNNWGYLLID